MKNARIVFMGTPEFAVNVLTMLIENYEVVLVVTQPDKPVGRKHILTPSPVKEVACKHHIKVFQPERIKKDYEEILAAKPDIIITCAYGQIIPKVILDAPTLGCFNVHASLLPKYRGGAPIHKAIINGEKETGVTIMYMDEGMDTGDMITKVMVPITEEDNVGTLHDKLSLAGTNLLKETLPSILNQTNPREKQKEEAATYAYNIKREEEHLNFEQKGRDIINHIRGLNPWPTANMLVNDEEWKVLEAHFTPSTNKETGIIQKISKESLDITCQDGVIHITKLKPFGKKTMEIKEFVNGNKDQKLIGIKVK